MATDSPRRDFEWRLHLAHKLSQHKIACIIGSNKQISTIHKKSRDCVFFGRFQTNSGRAATDLEFIKAMKKNGTKMFFLHDEGAFYLKGAYNNFVKTIYPIDYLNYPQIEKVYCWGERQKTSMEKIGVSTEKIKICGAPRFDLARPEYSHLDQRRTQALKKRYGSFTLICSRFAIANKGPSDPAPLGKRVRHLRSEGTLEAERSEDLTLNLFNGWSKVVHEFADFIPMIAKLALNFPEEHFVVRPHPAEAQSFYMDSLSHFDNVSITKEGDVRPWIRGSRIVIQSECTTGLEAYISGIPTLNFQPECYDFDDYKVAGLSDVGVVVTSYQELEFEYRKALCGSSQVSGRTEVKDYLYNLAPARAATDVIVEDIVSYIEEAELQSTITLPSLAGYLRGEAKRVGRKLKDAPLRPTSRGFSPEDSKHFEFDADSIRSLWKDMGGLASDLTIKRGMVLTCW